MIPGLSGSLLSHDALTGAFSGIGRPATTPNYRWFQTWYRRIVRDMGPASTARHVYDRVALPLATAIGLRVVPAVTPDTGGSVPGLLYKDGLFVAALIVTEWGRDPSSVWRNAVRTATAPSFERGIVITGPLVRVFDATHNYSRRFIQFDLEITAHDPAALDLLCALLGAEGFSGRDTALDRAVLLSEQHRATVRSSLQVGVHDAVTSLLRAFAAAQRRQRHISFDALFEESLVVIYRVLFLLFAEARGLVPKWHPTYRDNYTIESLREPTERLARPAGLWESIQAIARLAHRGCRAGSLRVPPFNGRLFSPMHAPLADSLALDDAAVREAILSLTTVQRGPVRRRIAYADLGVEQLGGVYERILDYAPVSSPGQDGSLTLKKIGRRKATGTYYTPRALTEFLVRRALAPLVKDASAEKILSLRVVDPAMGSGAFLVAVCRYLAAAYESALIRDGAMSSDDVTESDRAAFRRVIAQRCLFGVDVNPMAVQLARLSLWLTTLARDKPLTFLDHHLRIGNSLAGASIDDVLRRPECHRRTASPAQLPLFDLDQLDRDMTTIIATRLSLALAPDDSVDQVRTKERLLASLQSDDSPLTPWQRIANLWCADWFTTSGQPRSAKAFEPLVDEILGRARVVPAHLSRPLLDRAQRVAARERFFHWQLEFPEVFLGSTAPGPQAGFDAVIGNPPWEVLRGDGKSPGATALTTFSRQSGTYRWQGEGHANLYQLFLERALALTRPGGRIAMVVPSGFALDHGCARLRSVLLDRTSVDTFVTVENREAVFPIHRGLKFLLVAATRGQRTIMIPCRTGIRSASDLELIPDLGDGNSVDLPRSVVEQFSGEQLAIPEVRTSDDVHILGRTVFRFPALSSAEGWNVRFGRELNATDDREHFVGQRKRGCLPILEGKQIQPFIANVEHVTRYIADRDAARLLRSNGFRSSRLAYRDVASASNRLTLIAAIIPANVVTTHTLFCLKGDVQHDVQLFLCGIFNSFVANYLVRMRVGTHVTVAIMERLPVPRPPTDSSAFLNIVALTNRIMTTPTSEHAAEIQAAVAHLYQLSSPDFHRVLDTFPLVPLGDRRAAMEKFLRPD